MKLLSATATLVSFASAALAASDAGIYTYAAAVPAPSAVPTLSPANVRLVLADQLGLAQYYSLESADEDTITVLGAASSQKSMFEEKADDRKKVFLFFDGVEDIKDVLPEENGRRVQIASLSAIPSTERNERLVEETLRLWPGSEFGSYEEGFGGRYIAGGRRTHDGAWLVSRKSNSQEDNASREIERVNLLDSVDSPLQSYHITFPEEKEAYNDAVSVAKDTVTRLATTWNGAERDLIFMVATKDAIKAAAAQQASWGASGSTLSKRSQEAPLISLTDSAPSRPVMAQASGNSSKIRTTMERCSKSESECNSRTNKCSGHGKCNKRYGNKEAGECWVCQCSPTKINGIRQDWGGPACQKRDISVQFWLFAGFGILGTAAIAWGIGLLYSMGDAPLPSVLGAGVAPTNRK